MAKPFTRATPYRFQSMENLPLSRGLKRGRTEQYVQVGNAVPPLLGRKVAEALLRADKAAESPNKRRANNVQSEAAFAL